MANKSVERSLIICLITEIKVKISMMCHGVSIRMVIFQNQTHEQHELLLVGLKNDTAALRQFVHLLKAKGCFL